MKALLAVTSLAALLTPAAVAAYADADCPPRALSRDAWITGAADMHRQPRQD